MFYGQQINVHEEESSNSFLVVTDRIKAKIEAKMQEDRHFTIDRLN